MKLSDQITRRHLFVAFGSSMQTGSLSSVDLAATRDGSSVTLTASDGSVAPIAGADTSTAGVMTANDKARLDGLPPTDVQRFSVFSDMASATVDAAITHLATAGYAAPGDGGGASYRRVGAEPTHALKLQTADGAWWELLPEHGRIDIRQAGAVGDGVSDDSQAMQDCLDFAEVNESGGEAAMYEIVCPAGTFYFGSGHFNVKKAVRIVGVGTGIGAVAATQFTWDANVTGFIFHENDTIDATTTTWGSSAGGSALENVLMTGGGGTIANVTDGTKGHGIWLRTKVSLKNVLVENFAGNGLHVVADVAGSVKGNANMWSAENCTFTRNHLNGIFVDGDNANAGLATGCNCSGNGRWGIHESSVLGNTYLACHTYANGVATKGENGPDRSSVVEFAGSIYAANRKASEADLAATQPGTDDGIWIQLQAGSASATRPTWQSGQPSGTYFLGGPYYDDTNAATNLFIGCYAEYPTNQGPAQFSLNSMVIGGEFASNGLYGLMGGIRQLNDVCYGLGRWGWQNHHRYSEASGGNPSARELTRTVNDSVNEFDGWDVESDGGLSFCWDEGNGAFMLKHGSSKRVYQINTSLSPAAGGRSSKLPNGSILFPNGFWLGGTGFSGAVRHHTNGSAAPTGGDWARGDIVWNEDPSAGGNVGWVCVSGGSPGTWKAFGGIDP